VGQYEEANEEKPAVRENLDGSSKNEGDLADGQRLGDEHLARLGMREKELKETNEMHIGISPCLAKARTYLVGYASGWRMKRIMISLLRGA
jgi:hypothetical protein